MNPHIDLLTESKSSWMYPIYIPSYNRAGKAPLLELLKDAPRSVQRKVHIAVVPEQSKDYKRHYPWAKQVKTIPGLGTARMDLLVDAESRGYERIIMLDDDIAKINLLERITKENGKQHTRRHSSNISGMDPVMHMIRSIAVSCQLADSAFELMPDASYGAARNALFSGDVDTSIGATAKKGSFPSCVMFFDLERYESRELPLCYRFHGEDLSMSLEAMEDGKYWFTLPVVAYDQDSKLESTIPIDPLSERGRQDDMDNAQECYPSIGPYLRASYKNKLGGVMRIGFFWKRWYKANDEEPIEVPLQEMLEECGL